MNKRAATQYIDEYEVRLGDLRKMITDAKGRGGMSVVNKQLTHEQTHKIFVNCMAVDDREDGHVIKSWTYSGRLDREVRTRDFSIAVNIVRDCM